MLSFRLERRLGRIRTLLATRNDYIVKPSYSEEKPGLSPSKFVPCAGLEHTGRSCGNCLGTGTRRRRRSDPEWDAYTETWIGTEENPDGVRSMTTREIDASLARLERDEALRERLEDEEILAEDLEWWERARRYRDESGSYVELELALQTIDQDAVRFLDLYHAKPPLIEHTEGAEWMERKLVQTLSDRMPGKIIVPKWAHENEQEKVALFVKAMTAEGKDTAEIAREVGVSQRRVRQLRALKVT